MSMIQRLAVAAAVLLLCPMGATFAMGQVASASAPACTGDSVIVSMPLLNTRTGQSSYSYGYVQLWYNHCTGRNWANTHSLLSGTTYVDAIVYNNAYANSEWSSSAGPVATSRKIYSPNNPAGAFGDVEANGVVYFAESDQHGANCEVDTGGPCVF